MREHRDVVVLLGGTAIVHQADIVEQIGGHDLAARHVADRRDPLVEFENGHIAADRVDFRRSVRAARLAEHGEPQRLQPRLAVIEDLEFVRGHHHAAAAGFELDGAVQSVGVLAESLGKLAIDLIMRRRQRQFRAYLRRVRGPVGRGQRRQAVDAAHELRVDPERRKENAETAHRQQDALEIPHGKGLSIGPRTNRAGGSLSGMSAGELIDDFLPAALAPEHQLHHLAHRSFAPPGFRDVVSLENQLRRSVGNRHRQPATSHER